MKEKVDKEIEYFEKEHEKSFERTYGWAWLLKLQVNIFLSSSIYKKMKSLKI